ncbi:MAG: class I SAM-dependent methyltransferase [Gemmatimonadaceae bacterium]
MDLWGRIFADHWRGEIHPHTFVRDDGRRHTIASAAEYFDQPREVVEVRALNELSGRVLDLGCGAGTYALFLEQRGVSVTAIDSSPGAVDVCRARGCRDARAADIDLFESSADSFDAIICMGNTLGINKDPATLPKRLSRLRTFTKSSGRLIAAVRDPLNTTDPEHLSYHRRNRAAGRPVGLTRSRLEYRGELGEWWELWMPTRSEMQEAAGRGGWSLLRTSEAGLATLYELAPVPWIADG